MKSKKKYNTTKFKVKFRKPIIVLEIPAILRLFLRIQSANRWLSFLIFIPPTILVLVVIGFNALSQRLTNIIYVKVRTPTTYSPKLRIPIVWNASAPDADILFSINDQVQHFDNVSNTYTRVFDNLNSQPILNMMDSLDFEIIQNGKEIDLLELPSTDSLLTELKEKHGIAGALTFDGFSVGNLSLYYDIYYNTTEFDVVSITQLQKLNKIAVQPKLPAKGSSAVLVLISEAIWRNTIWNKTTVVDKYNIKISEAPKYKLMLKGFPAPELSKKFDVLTYIEPVYFTIIYMMPLVLLLPVSLQQ